MSRIRGSLPRWLGAGRLVLTLGLALACVACDKPSEQADGTADTTQEQPAQAPATRPEVKCEAAKPGGPEDVVLALYQHYSPEKSPMLQGEPRAELDKYLAPRFRDAILHNQTCEDNTGDDCGFDWDMLYNTQDTRPTEYKVCKMATPRNVVTVTFRQPDGPDSVTWQLTQTPAGWRIADIVSLDESKPSSVVEGAEKPYADAVQMWKKAQQPEPPGASGEPLPQCAPAPEKGPESLVRTLYEQYPWQNDRIVFDEPRETLLKYFDRDTADVIAAIHARRKAKGAEVYYAMPNLLINNDILMIDGLSTFRICAMDQKTRTVRALFRLNGETVVVAYQMKQTPDGMRISDIYLPAEGAAGKAADTARDWSLRDAVKGED